MFIKILLPLRNGDTIGKYSPASAPNISGAFYDLAVGADLDTSGALTMGQGRGAFYAPPTLHPLKNSSVQKATARTTINAEGDGLEFSAARSSPVYGRAATVMPESAEVTVGIYLGRASEV